MHGCRRPACRQGDRLWRIRGVSNQAKSPTRFRNLPFLPKISRFQSRFQDFDQISRFQSRFQDFRQISRFQSRFQDFRQISTFQEISQNFVIHVQVCTFLLKSFLHVYCIIMGTYIYIYIYIYILIII